MTTEFAVPVEQDPFLFDTEQLHTIAGTSTIGKGLAYFKDHRVAELDRDECRLWASVEARGGDPVRLCGATQRNG